MAKLVCMTLPYMKFPLERALEGIARAGYKYVAFGLPHDGVQVPSEDNIDAEVTRLQQLFNTYSLQPSMLIGNRQFAPDQPIERAVTWLQIAQRLGIQEVLSVGTNSYRKFPSEPISDEEMKPKNEQFAKHFKQIGDEAARLGITITIKPHTGNTATAKHLVETLQQIGSDHVLASYDPGNVQYYEGVVAETDFPLIAKQTYSIVAKDHRGAQANLDFPVPGSGDVNFPALLKTWKDAGRDGQIVVERIDGPADLQLIDQRFTEGRIQLEKIIHEAGFTLE